MNSFAPACDSKDADPIDYLAIGLVFYVSCQNVNVNAFPGQLTTYILRRESGASACGREFVIQQ